MATRGSAGWIILVAALAVPGFLFYNWWTHMNNESRRQLSVKVRNRMPPGTPMFGQAPVQERLNNPISSPLSPSSSPATAAAAQSTTTAAEQQPVSAGAPPAAVQAPAAAEQTAAGAAALPAAAVPMAAELVASPSAGTLHIGPIAQIVLARDPMLSPYDAVRIQEEEMRIRLAQEQVEAARNRKPQKIVKTEKPIEMTVELQGIVSTAEGDKAIVNGEVVGEGDLVGQARVVKITSTAVIFLYRNKRFIKGISK